MPRPSVNASFEHSQENQAQRRSVFAEQTASPLEMGHEVLYTAEKQYPIPMPVSPEKLQKLQEMMLRLGVHKNDLEEKFVRGSGKGGQKVNKTNKCVYLTHVPSGIVIRCHCEREREINRYLARRTLCEELDHRINGAPSPRQLELKRARKRGGKPRSCSITQRKMEGD